MEWTGGGSGGWREGKGQAVGDGLDSGAQKEIPEIRLQLGRKVVTVGLAQQAQNENRNREWDGDRDVGVEQRAYLTTMSLWTRDVDGVVPLV